MLRRTKLYCSLEITHVILYIFDLFLFGLSLAILNNKPSGVMFEFERGDFPSERYLIFPSA